MRATWKRCTIASIYSDMLQETGASTATISRVNKCLVYGSDGYRRMLDRLKEDHE